MTNITNRRAALGLFVAAPAAMAALVTGKAMAAPPDDIDSALFELQEEIDAADRELEAALDALAMVERERRQDYPPRPTAPEMDAATQEAIKEFGEQMRAIREREPTAEQIAHEEALQRWEDEKAQMDAESGVEAVELAAMNAVTELQARIVATPAKTMAGLIFKARYARAHYPTEYDQDVMDSVIDDLLAMSDEA